MDDSIKHQPAFPFGTWHPDMGWSPAETPMGLSKREYFASLAMQGLLRGAIPLGQEEYKEVAKHALGFSDALIQELEKDD